ncbi:MAG: type VI secretion system contractile sheath large subunit [SAR324 cluster bacterium]|nr:type VI secretion system contractile sheath large subunit [SAR324 cluster bacterium]
MAEKKASKAKEKQISTDRSLLQQVMEQTRIGEGEESYATAKTGLEEFLKEMLKDSSQVRVEKKRVDAMLDALDAKLSSQMDEILHHPEFQKKEAAWKSLKVMAERTNFRENIQIQIINVSKDDLLEDFEDAGDETKSGLYQHIYTNEYGQFGGKPVGVLVGNYTFGPGAQDIKLLRHVASVAAMAHAPFIAAAGPAFFNINSFDELPNLKDLESVFTGPQYAKWQSFREADDSRNVGLALPNFLLRNPYNEDNPAKAFNYKEETNGVSTNYLWGNAAFALCTRITESFEKYRWCPNIVGPQSGGGVTDLPLHVFERDGKNVVVGPTEVRFSDRREYELSEEGFVPLTMRKDSDNATFFSVNSVQKPKFFGTEPEQRQAEMNYRLGTQLPYLFVVNRLAHYIKVLQREKLGSWKSRAELETELNRWLRQYVSDQENPSAEIRGRRPLRRANVQVNEVEGEAGWYRVDITVTPHFKFMGANFTLSLSGRLDMT